MDKWDNEEDPEDNTTHTAEVAAVEETCNKQADVDVDCNNSNKDTHNDNPEASPEEDMDNADREDHDVEAVDNAEEAEEDVWADTEVDANTVPDTDTTALS